jgi:hypothetical protein
MLTPSISNAVVDLIIFSGSSSSSEQQVAIGIFDPRQKRAQRKISDERRHKKNPKHGTRLGLT